MDVTTVVLRDRAFVDVGARAAAQFLDVTDKGLRIAAHGRASIFLLVLAAAAFPPETSEPSSQVTRLSRTATKREL
jgi:hypothetical protein